MAQNRHMRTVFTLKSGKSIVVTILETKAFSVYNEWVKFIPNGNNDVSKINIDKKQNNMIVENIGILLSEIAAIQIVEDTYKKSN